MSLILNLLVNGFAVFVASYLLSAGVHMEGFLTAVIVSVALGIVNILIKPIVLLFTLPINILTLGLFTFIINGLMVLLVSVFVPGFKVDSFVWAMAFSVVLWAINFVFNSLIKK